MFLSKLFCISSLPFHHTVGIRLIVEEWNVKQKKETGVVKGPILS